MKPNKMQHEVDFGTCLNSLLVDLQFLEGMKPHDLGMQFLRICLMHLRTFLVCARKWGNNKNASRLEAFLVRIEDVISRIAREIHPTRLSCDCSGSVSPAPDFFNFYRSLGSFRQEINQWYIHFSDHFSNKSRSCSPGTRDELLEFLESLSDCMIPPLDFSYRYRLRDSKMLNPLEALVKRIILLRNFIRFTTLRAVDDRHLNHLLTHIKAVAVEAAHHCFMSRYGKLDEDDIKEMPLKISGLLQRIKPVDPQVRETYVQALTVLKLSKRQSCTGTAALETKEPILEGFIDSLLSHFWEILTTSTVPMLSMDDQMQVLYEGLRSLRIILKKQPENFDEELWDLTEVVICDAGVVIFSLFLDAIEDVLAEEIYPLLFDLLERIKLIRAKVTGVSPQGSTLNFPTVDGLGFIDFLLENLTEMTSCDETSSSSIATTNHRIQIICEELVFLRRFLGKIEQLRDENEELQALRNSVVELAYRADFLIDSSVIGDIPDSSLMSFDSIREDARVIKLDAMKFFDEEGLDDVVVKKVIERSNHLPSSERSIPLIENEIVGLDDEATSIKARLKGGSKNLKIVAVVGMPGLGKTTLAKLVYNDPSMKCHFHVHAWCCISQVYNKKNLLLEILTCISDELTDEYFMKSEEDLALVLYQRLRKKRYLIVLDDMWDIDSWNILRESFPDDAIGSRIILTTRNGDVLPMDKLDKEPHFLRQLTNDESWKLLKVKLFLRDNCPPTLCELCRKIVEKCNGLPLTIVILAGILGTMEQNNWKEAIESLNSGIVSSSEQCKNLLELSYKHLPDKLKSCFLYFGVFPEDQEHTLDELIWLWIAEGFVQKVQSKSLEDEAKDYLILLMRRNLVMVAKQSSIGGIKTCRIHDLLYEFCMEKAKEVKLFHLIQEYDDIYGFNEPYNVYRLSIYSKFVHFRDSRLFCPRVRSVFLFHRAKTWYNADYDPLLCIGMSKFVRVLDLRQFSIATLFPDVIGWLVQLRYLAVGGIRTFIPSSIANLSKLETLILNARGTVLDLPDEFWNLKKLRHVKIRSSFRVPKGNIDNSTELCNLDTVSSVLLQWQVMEKTLRKIPNISKLKLKVYFGFAWKCNEVLALDYLSRLQSLNIDVERHWNLKLKIEQLSFPWNLRKLTLSNFGSEWSKISAIGNLPNLEVLKLLFEAFTGESWNMEEEMQFPKLSFLKLSRLPIVRWTSSESVRDHFPRLVKLVLDYCYNLKEVPSCLGDIQNLQMIEVSYCPESAVSSVKQIQEEQVSMGNEDMKVLIRPSNRGSGRELIQDI